MANIPTVSWDESRPAGTRDVNLGDNDIKEFKTQMRELIAADHKMSSSGQAADWGLHNKLTLLVQTTITALADAGIVYSKDVASKAELHFKDEDGDEIQITSGGKLLGTSIQLPNNTYLLAANAAGDGTVNLIRATASNKAGLPDGAVLATSAAPTADNDIANKKYVDDSTPSGMVVQVQYHQRQDEVTCNTAIPQDNSTRTSSEGTLVLTKAITPRSNSNILKIEVSVIYGSTVVTGCLILFDGTTVLATSRCPYAIGGGGSSPMPIVYYMTSPGTAEKTFNVRLGDASAAGKLNVGTNLNSYDNGKLISTLTITEIKG